MSDGVDGLVSAASVARDMVRTFPAPRFGLLVGLGGGGLPNLSQGVDIRLGDIVVSKPTGLCGGVVQYDKGKAEKGGKLVLKGQLNQPPNLLLRTLTNIRARHAKNPAKLSLHINNAITRDPMLQENGFTYPSRSDCLHCHACDQEIETLNADCKELHIKRTSRKTNSPVIHYGIIASGNQVIKDATLRNRLRDEFDALCVEMEAAGLMNDFPCLVIRGICDYADSNKNDEWHPYAAMAAAAYTKEILQLISPVEARKAQPIQVIPDVLDKIRDTSRAHLDATRARNQDDKVQYGNDKIDECHHSLKVTPYKVQMNINPERVPGTCQWVLTHPRYVEWQNKTEKALLWISADPGCGKSVLAKSLIDNELRNTANHTICYFFFKDNGEQNELSTALCSLLHQLFSHRPGLIRHAMEPWKKNSNQLFGEVYQLWRILLACAEGDEAQQVTCVLDAMDKCRPSDRSRLIKMLTDFYDETASLTSKKQQSYLKFLVTSRPYADIETNFRASIEKLPTIRLKGEDENEQIHHEIDLVVRMRVEKLTRDLNLDDDTKDKLTDKLLGMQHRTYLWLYLAIDGIYETHRSSLRPNEAAIETLPSTVEDAYEKILQRVPKTQEANTKRILQIMIGARRPLTVAEMAFALGLATSAPPIVLKKARLETSWLEANIRHWCGLFIFINHDRIYLIHQTAKEFLICHGPVPCSIWGWKQSIGLTQREELMGRICAGFLCSDQVVCFSGERPVRLYKADNSFFRYAAEHWVDHFRHLQILPLDKAFMTEVIRLYDFTPDGLFDLWYPVYERVNRYPLNDRLNTASVVAMLRHDRVLGWMLRSRISYDMEDALEIACEYGHAEVLRMLLKEDAKDRMEIGDHFQGLKVASEKGHEKIVSVLIEQCTYDQIDFEEALLKTSYKGHLAVVQAILRLGADMEAASFLTIDALRAALYEGHEEVAWTLLESGAPVKDTEEHFFPLYEASQRGYERIVQRLLKWRVKINNRGGRYGTALHAAVRYNHPAILQLLLDKKADINIKGPRGTALQMASKLRRTEIVGMLRQLEDEDIPPPTKKKLSESATMQKRRHYLDLQRNDDESIHRKWR